MTKIIFIIALLSCTKRLNGNFRNKMNGNEYVDVDLSALTKVLRKNNSTPTPLDIKKGKNGEIEGMLRTIFDDHNIIFEGTSEEIKKIITLVSNTLDKGNEEEIARLRQIFVDTTSIECKQNILMIASSFCSLNFVELLIYLGMDINYSDKTNITPLMCAAGRTDREAIKIINSLLKAEADKTRVNNFSKTALDIAINQEIKDLLKGK